MFASTETGAMIDRAECALLCACAHAVAHRRPEEAVFATELAGGVAVYAGDGSPLNKVAGLGFAGVPDEAAMDAIEHAYAQRDAPVQVELSSLGDARVATMLTRRGYRLEGFEHVMGLTLPTPAREPAIAVRVDPSSKPDSNHWLRVVVDGFTEPDTQGAAAHESFPREAIEAAISDMALAEGVRRYLARIDDAPASGASMFVARNEGVALLCGAATLPPLRGRGAHRALLERRLADAAAVGCAFAALSAMPGSKSQENAQRRGFALLLTRAILRLHP